MTSAFSVEIGSLVPKNQQLVTIDSKLSVIEALDLLSSKNIYSAPVFDAASGNYYGFLDLADIVVFLVALMEEKGARNSKQFNSFLESIKKLDLESAKNVADLSSMNPMVPLRAKDPLSEAFRLFQSTGTHRIPVLKGEEVASIANVLTQMDVITFLAKDMNTTLGESRKKTLKDLNVKLDKVISVDINSSAFEAFQLMSKNRITGVAVLNPDGTLFSNLSVKDIKNIPSAEISQWMGRTVLELIQMMRSKQIDVTFPVFSVHIHNTLEDVLSKLNILRVHRLFITDDANKPIGILTLGDLFKLLNH